MIKTWNERCEDHPDHNGIVTERMIQARMQEEIDELRAAIEQPRQWQGLTDDEIAEVISGQFAERNYWVKITKALEAKLKEKNA